MDTISMPKLSDSMTEGVLVRWLVTDGSEVRRGDEIAEIETDKATMVFEAESNGRLTVHSAEGATVAVGSPIAYLLGDGENPPAPQANQAFPLRIKASPLARRLAAERGVDLSGVTGSGPAGRIVRADVEAATTAETGATAAQSADRPGAAAGIPDTAPETDTEPGRTDTRANPPESAGGHDPASTDSRGAATHRKLTRAQQVVARRMVEAKSSAPEFTVQMVVDAAPLTALRDSLRGPVSERVPSVNDFIVRAAAVALRRHPGVNASYVDGALQLFARVNVGIAVDTEESLVVPVIHDADIRSVGTIAAEARALSEAARQGRLTAESMSGGTFTVSNLGMFGVRAFTAVLNPPQAAILAVGAIEDVAVVAGGLVTTGRQLTLTLTCDHRVVYGAGAARFLGTVRDLLQQPLRLLL